MFLKAKYTYIFCRYKKDFRIFKSEKSGKLAKGVN